MKAVSGKGMSGLVLVNQPDVLTPKLHIQVIAAAYVWAKVHSWKCDCIGILQRPLQNHRTVKIVQWVLAQKWAFTWNSIVYISSRTCQCIRFWKYILMLFLFLLSRPSLDLVRFTALTWTQLTFQISIGSFYSGVFKMIMCVTMFLIALMQLGFTSVA